MMADIAAIFHWSKADMDQMDFTELLGWHRRAVKRWNSMQGQE